MGRLLAEQGRRRAAEPGLTADQRAGVERYQQLVEQIIVETGHDEHPNEKSR
ncbi:hypothetical protein [Nonomuraea sp. NPDC049400]|uniref:hypothetical protein n=1 Tax=Nonomuraea sp. NPDC049400 TaxID=3364352 RepID=UPI0037ABD5D2